MSVYTIGDLHLSLGVDKPMDVFDGWGNYVERLRDNWNAIVSPADTVVVVGDISWAMTLEEAVTDFAFIENLPGQKILLKGNHDYWWTTMRKMNAWRDAHGFQSIQFLFNNAYITEGLGICGTRSWFYEEDSADEKIFAREMGRLRASIDAVDRSQCDKIAAFLHYPPVYHGKAVTEIIQALTQNGIGLCYYGHVHGASIPYAFNGTTGGVTCTLVSADYLKFKPLKIIQ